jgi:hypothetical protein
MMIRMAIKTPKVAPTIESENGCFSKKLRHLFIVAVKQFVTGQSKIILKKSEKI